jgi:RNA polymerase sigma-70 factor (ECF subfamily)
MYVFLSTISDDTQRYAIEQLFEKYYAKMVHAANKILHNVTDAEDAVMEAFKNICKVPERFIEYESKEVVHLAFLYVQSAARTIYKKNKRRNGTFIPLDPENHEEELEAIPDQDQNVAEMAINNINKKIIMEAIESLDEDHKIVIILKYYYSMKNCDIAEIVGTSATNVAGRAFRARKKIWEYATAKGVML